MRLLTNSLMLTLILTLLSAGALAQERITLKTPVVPPPAITDYRPGALFLQAMDPDTGLTARIVVTLLRSDHRTEVFEYPCGNGCLAMDSVTEVQAAIVALNSQANMTVRTLWRRVFDALVRDFPERFGGQAVVQ